MSARQGTIVRRDRGVGAGAGAGACVMLVQLLWSSLCRDGTITGGKYLLDILWQRTTLCVQSELDAVEPVPVDPSDSSPAELDRYGGGLSPSNTVRFGGGRMHF